MEFLFSSSCLQVPTLQVPVTYKLEYLPTPKQASKQKCIVPEWCTSYLMDICVAVSAGLKYSFME